MAQHWRGDPRERPTPRRVFFLSPFHTYKPQLCQLWGMGTSDHETIPPWLLSSPSQGTFPYRDTAGSTAAGP